MFKKVGFRTIKTGIAVTLSLIVSDLLKLEYPFYAAIAAVILMDKTAVNSMKLSKNRILGTFIGFIVGTMFWYIDAGNPILCGIGIIIMIVICNALKLSGSVAISSIVLIAIMIHPDELPYFYGFNRILDTCIGAAISLLVNTLIFPYYSVNHLNEIVIKMWEQSDTLLHALKDDASIDLSKVHYEMRSIENELNVYEKEILLNKKKELVGQLRLHYEMTEQLLFEIEACKGINREVYPEVFAYHYDRANAIYSNYINKVQMEDGKK